MDIRIFIVVSSALIGWSFPAISAEPAVCYVETSPASIKKTEAIPLPEREGPRIRTTGRVPHMQIGVDPVAAINKELYQLAFSLPGVEKRPTIVSMPGADGIWLGDKLPISRSKVIVAGREFAHIHPDGSLHAPLPIERAIELADKGWGERHPWADRREGWEGFVMIYTPQSMEELQIVIQLVLDSYNYVTGQSLGISNC